jgi:outer membrane protein
MKKLLKSVAAGLLLIGLSASSANAQKIAHIDLDSLISLMPEYKKAQEDVQEYAKQLEQQITAMQSELQTKYAEYQAKARDMAEIVRMSKEKELNDLNQRIQDFQQQAQIDYQKKSADVIKPVNDKAKKAIEQVAKENSYKYVLDTSAGLVLYFEPAEDILALVIKKLNITVPPAGMPTPVKR